MAQRLTYRRRHSYNTRSNKVKIVRTPGNRLVYHYRTKLANGPSCGDCGCKIHGIPHLRPKQYRLLHKNQRTVTRAYGGSRCANCVKDRIIRSFLIQEQMIVKSVLKAKEEERKAQEAQQAQQAPK